MTDLTEKKKKGKIEALEELINQITTVDDSRSLSDEYLKEKGLMTRDECGVAGEYPYGIVMVVSDYVLPYLKKLQELKKENQQLKELMKRVVNATDFRHEIKIASVIDYRVWYNIASEIKQAIGEK